MLLADELNGQQALAVAETLEEIQCRNPQLINKYVLLFFLLTCSLAIKIRSSFYQGCKQREEIHSYV